MGKTTTHGSTFQVLLNGGVEWENIIHIIIPIMITISITCIPKQRFLLIIQTNSSITLLNGNAMCVCVLAVCVCAWPCLLNPNCLPDKLLESVQCSRLLLFKLKRALCYVTSGSKLTLFEHIEISPSRSPSLSLPLTTKRF